MTKKILYVYAPAGPPLDYAFERIARRGEIHTCVVTKPSDYQMEVLRRHSASMLDLTDRAPEAALAEVERLAHELKPDAIVTFAEYLLKSVSEIAHRFGVRGVGPNVDLGRNKVLMRDRWREAGIPQPAHVAVSEPQHLERIATLRMPIIVKLAYGAGSIAQQVVHEMRELDGAIARLLEASAAAQKAGKHEYTETHAFPLLIAEEIIPSTTESWYDVDGYGDYLSVEGIVRDGIYHPLAMTGRLRTIPPYTELGNVAPCILEDDKKARIVAEVTRAVQALGFENCATHTELKLTANGGMSFLETAARMGGVAIAKELDSVFGIDYVGLFIDTVLGEPCEIPAFEANPPRCAAASVALIGCDSTGTPWDSRRSFTPAQVDWAGWLGEQTQVNIERAQAIPEGSPMPVCSLSAGQMNYAGQAFVVCPTPAELRTAAYALIDGLETRLAPLP